MKLKLLERNVNLITDLTTLELACSYYLTHWCAGNNNTRRAKQNDISKFFGFVCEVEQNDAPILEQVSKATIERWCDYLLKCGESTATVNRRIATIKHFCGWAARMWGIDNVGQNVHAVQAKESLPRWLDENEIKELRAALDTLPSGFDRERMRLCIDLGLDVGLRAAEICELRAAHLDLGRNLLVHFRRKGRKFDTKPLNARLRSVIDTYMPLRDEYLAHHDHGWRKSRSLENQLMYPLVVSHWCAQPCNPDSWRMNPRTLRRILSTICVKAGIEHINPHRLRHSFCKRLLEATKDLSLVAQAAGHGSIETTRRYVTSSENEMRNALECLK